ncbi:MAG: o-succinylbenzoate--CoA ligase [FCB group bacterium]|nr:o-succinylbenzoate--CoA ligase [FCB group bacterium]MBL7028497.1 o-succinylbenzoate--CoA ligase [Candidatus Neomarinimicrobiota bacterium]MBL7121561.1 o-succinylbenzoate--CoA ligase [Candidatus Neomarinimicrobiota bacterium]
MNYSTKAKQVNQHPLLKTALKYPSRPAVQFGDLTLTYSNLYLKAKQLATGLSLRGVQQGQLIALGDLQIKDMVVLVWACILGGYIAFPLNVRFPVSSLAQILTNIKPTLIISNSSYPHHTSVVFSELERDADQQGSIDLPPYDSQKAATLLMTSGSSGDVKFVQHSHHNHIESARGSNRNIELNSSDSWLLSLPLYHVGGLSILFRAGLSGAVVIIPEEKDSLLEEIDEYGVTHISLVATQLQRLLKDEAGPRILKGMKAILLGGSAIPPTLIQQALNHDLPIHVSYGSTEMASQITTTFGSNRESALQNSGKVLPGRDLIISHEGEILTKGETLAQGYLLNSSLIDLRDEAGWFHTGDVGYTNVQGELTVTGRMDNQFISGGENVQPEHIERVLCKIPGIHNAIVIPQPDEEFGARPVAFLEIEDDAPNGEEISQQLRGHLPGYMLPVAYYEFPVMQIDNSFKISRQELINQTQAGNIDLHSL